MKTTLTYKYLFAFVSLFMSISLFAQSTLTWSTDVTANDQATGFKWFGVKTPATATNYLLSAITLRLVNGSKTTDQTDSYLAIATTATANTTLAASDVIAVSSNHLQPTTEADYTYQFASPVTLNGDATYYLYWVSSNTPVNGNYTSVGQRAKCRNSSTYEPGVYLNGVRYDLMPIFSATLTYTSGDISTLHTLTVSTLPAVYTTFTWNGQTRRGTSATFVYEGNAVTGDAATVTIAATDYYDVRYPENVLQWDGQTNVSTNVEMLSDIFSETYGEKWVRVIFPRDANYHWSVASATDVPKCTNSASPDDGNLWCFLGTQERFVIYNKLVGETKGLATSAVSSGSYASFVDIAQADAWTLGSTMTLSDNAQVDGTSQTTGLPIYRYGSESAKLGLNAYRGKGNQLAYWDQEDGGSLWIPMKDIPADTDIYSETYGEKWVRITYGASNRYCLMVTPKETLSYNNSMVRNGRTDMTHEGQLWCLVGNAEGFKLYNRLAGENYAATTGSALNGTQPLILTSASRGATFIIQDGVCLSNKTNLTTGIAPIGSNGSPAGAEFKVGFISKSNSKCSYLFEPVRAMLDITLQGLPDEVPATHSHVARGAVTFPIGSSTRQLNYNLTPTQHTLFLPQQGVLSLTKPVCWIGYDFGGFSVDGGSNVQTLRDVSTETESLTATFTETNPEVRYIAYDGDERDIPYRIPSITRATNGDIIAMYDLRYNEADIGYYDRGFYHYRIDLVMKVSKDGGLTWGDEQVAAAGDNSGRFTAAFGDAAMVADCERNLVLVLAAAGNTGFGSAVKMARFYLKLNETTGEWESGYLNARGNFVKGKPQDITDTMLALKSKGGLSPSVYSAFCGSGRMLQSKVYKKGDYYRVYFTAIVKSNNTDGTWGQNGNITFYSDDFGQTWNILGERAAYTDSDEPKCEELPNGDIWMSGRAANGRNFNIYHFTDIATGEGTWLNRRHTYSGSGVTNGIYSSENACNGDIMLLPAVRVADNQNVTLALVSAPGRSSFTDPVWGATGRRHVSIYYKALVSESDYATTEALASNWEARNASTAFVVSEHMSAYSSMCLMKDGRIGFFLEDDVVTSTAPWSHFDMVFIPYSLETITNGKYTINLDRVTAISSAVSVPTTRTDAVYDLQGRRVVNPRNGIYIIGGKKVIR